MKLADMINQARRRSSEGRNLLRNPASLARRRGRKLFESWYRDADVGGKGPGSKSPGGKKKLLKIPGLSSFTNKVRRKEKSGQDSAVIPSTANQSVPLVNLGVGASASVSTQLVGVENLNIPPALQTGEIIKGTWWGRYTVGDCQYNGPRFRRYTGLQNNGNRPVWIYEYQLLESDFNQRDADQRRHAFKELIDLNLRLGNERDFRINKLQDVVANADRRCFLITQAVPGAQMLSDYVKQSGTLTAQQVRRVLHQGLQTLQYLHSSYRTRWPDNVVERGLYHGNLSLDSLWICPSPTSLQSTSDRDDPQFFVYFSNFLLWEHLFATANEQGHRTRVAKGIVEIGSISQDLADLGHIGFHLLTGGSTNPQTRLPYDVSNPDDWPRALRHHPLQAFIWRLMKLYKQQPFNSAGVALSALRNVPKVWTETWVEETIEEVETEPQRHPAWYWLLLMAIGGGTLAGLSFLPVFTLMNGKTIQADVTCEDPCRLQAMTVPTERVRYGIEIEGSWQTAFNRAEAWPSSEQSTAQAVENQTKKPGETVASADGEKTPQKPPTWETTLERRVTKASNTPFNLDLEIESRDAQNLYQAMVKGEIDFALMQVDSSAPEQSIPSGFTADVVAYDGIVAVVPYSDATREHNIAQRLKGKISLQTLREIYTGQLTALEGQPVVPYFPLNPTIESATEKSQEKVRFNQASVAITPFSTLLFETLSPEEKSLQLQSFRSIEVEEARSIMQAIEAEPNLSERALRYDIFARMFRDFEQAVVTTPESVPTAIGFEQLSRAFGQCSVYPLAISNERQAVQPFLQSGNRPLSINTNLCDDKGSYWPNVQAFESGDYPLAYPLAVVYPKNSTAGEAVGQMLNTAEGQYLLSESGLVPKLAIPTLRQILWSPPND